MKARTTKPKKDPGYIARSGKKPVMLALTPEQHARLAEAAERDGRSMTQVALRGALAEIERILADS